MRCLLQVQSLLCILWPSDAIWWYRSGSTLAQVMAYCPTTPNHYLDQCWLLISKVLWYSPEINFTASVHATVLYNEVKTRTTRMPAFWGYPPPPNDYPYHWVILDPKSKEDKVKVTNLKSSPKFQILEFWNGHYTRHTFWSCLIRCANMKWIRWVLLKIQSRHDSVHRRTDRQTDKVIPVYPPFNFVEAVGIIILLKLLPHFPGANNSFSPSGASMRQ